MRVKTRPGFWFWLGLPLAFAFLLGERVALFLFYVHAGALLSSWLWYRSAARLKVGYHLRQHRIYHGQSLEIEVTASNAGRVPFYQVRQGLIFSKINGPDQVGWEMAVALAPGQAKAAIGELRGLTRGVYRLAEAGWEAGDLFGLVSFSGPQDTGDELLVYPQVIALDKRESSLNQNHQGDIEMAAGYDVFSSYGVRSYHPGDKLSHIHWKVSARKGALHTKEFQQDYTSEGWLILYLPRGSETESLELAITTAASLAGHYLPGGGSLGLIIGGSEEVVLSPDRGTNGLRLILDALARTEYGSEGILPNLAGKYFKRFRGPGSVSLITPVINEEALETAEFLKVRGVLKQVIITGQGNLHGAQEPLLKRLTSSGICWSKVCTESQLTQLARRGGRWT